MIDAIKLDHKNNYWLCGDCAKSGGGVWPQGHCCTVTVGTCPYCKTSGVTLIPWVDFDWPKDKSTDINAKIGRD